MSEIIEDDIPPLDRVEFVLLCVDVEVWKKQEEDDRATLKLYLDKIRNALPEGDDRLALFDQADEYEPSEHDSEVECLYGKVTIEVSPEEWVKIADNFCIDLNGLALPTEGCVATGGILTAEGLIPAAAIESTDEGFGTMWYEPSMIASFYVAVNMKPEED